MAHPTCVPLLSPLYILLLYLYLSKGASIVVTTTALPSLSPKSRPSLDVLNGIHDQVPAVVRSAVERIDFASLVRSQRSNVKLLSMNYGIFQGQSALRELSSEEPAALLGYSAILDDQATTAAIAPVLSKTASALLLLCLYQRSDAAHEVLLGVTLDGRNLDEAEYAASHPGQTTWAADHPLTECDDMLHSIIHRLCEGSTIGEGGYTGWENAAYWAAGGPKYRYSLKPQPFDEEHAIRSALACAALQYTPNCVQKGIVVTTETRMKHAMDKEQEHDIIAGGGTKRTVVVPDRWWDPFCFVGLIQASCNDGNDSDSDASVHSELRDELDWLQELELRLLLRHELLKSCRSRLDLLMWSSHAS